MVAVTNENKKPGQYGQSFVSYGSRHVVSIACLIGVPLMVGINMISKTSRGTTVVSREVTGTHGGNIRGTPDTNSLQCRFFLAESAVPNGGLGVFTAIDVEKGQEAQSMPDICLYVADTPKGTQFETHSWARDVFMGTFEGENPRAACEGVATLFNSMPDGVSTSKLVSMNMHSNAGLERAKNPGAGAVTHYYGITSEAIRDIPAGSELTIDYGDWEYDEDKKYEAPVRTVEWLRKHGMCIDNIKIQQATDPEMGRGAFARRALPKGTLVAPAPLQTFPDRKEFAKSRPEALFVNYCFQIQGTDVLLFPYGPGVNMINHSSKDPNVGLRWSTSPKHHASWLDLSADDFWNMIYPGALILEVVALRDIAKGEQLFMDYGPEWEQAWKSHVRHWKPVKGAKDYVYPADMDVSLPFRTLEEQQTQPYASNLATACFENDWDIKPGRPIEWTKPEWWPEGLTYCNILDRKEDKKSGSFLYTVSLGFHHSQGPHKKDDLRYIDAKVPQSAIMFVDKPYQSDLHLANAFRQPIALPDHLVPSKWRTTK